jgi:hypothetical protein
MDIHFQCPKNYTFLVALLACMAPKHIFSLHCSRPAGICNRTTCCYFCIHRRKLAVSGCHQLLHLELELSSCMSVIQLKYQKIWHIKTEESFLNSGYNYFECHVPLCSSFRDLQRTRAEHALLLRG